MYILASQSPRRKQLFKEDISSDFLVEVADIDEHVEGDISPLDYVNKMAYRKGEVIFNNHPNDVVISADTIVVFNNKILGKPVDKIDAYNILKMLSGRKHEVITAYCIFSKDKIIKNHVVSDVYFFELNDDLINEYIASGSPLDKAGAYGIQDGERFPIVKEYKGSYKNIVGFPTDEIIKDLKSEF